MLKDHPFVSIIIVNHNGKELMKECLDSLSGIDYSRSRFEIIVVDNCSEDDSVEFIKSGYRHVKIIENKANNYCQACNFGIIKAVGEYIVFLNNDVRVTEKWLIELVRAMERDTTIGAATSRLLKDDGTIQNAGLYELPNFYWGERGAGKENKEYDFEADVDAISGACVLYRKAALDEVGLLDEDFVMYGEDVDMSIRLKEKRWRIVYIPLSIAYHKLHGSCSEPFAREAIERNRLLLIAKHFPEKLPNALLGSGYFVADKARPEVGFIFNLMPFVFLKLFKEHNVQIACRVVREILGELKRIINYDTEKLENDLKNILDDLIETRKDRDRCRNDISRLNCEYDNIRTEAANQSTKLREELESAKGEIGNLSNRLKDSLDKGLVKDSNIIELEAKLRDYKEEVENLSNRLKDSLDKGLVKDSNIIELEAKLRDYKEEVGNISKKLNESFEVRAGLENTLVAIYNSESYRFVLKPLWKVISCSKLVLKYITKAVYVFVASVSALVVFPMIALQFLFFIVEWVLAKLLRRLLISCRRPRIPVPFEKLNISVVIPNWNGIELLKKCLVSIYEIDAFREGKHEVLVVDDASASDIARCIKGEFPGVRVIRNKHNKGFGRSCNIGVREAKGELIVLLNNDIMVSKDFLEPLVRHFKNDNIFAVAPKLYCWDKETFNYGMQMGRFRDGYLSLWNEAETGNGDKVSQAAPTVFAIGGAMVFRKKDFLWLGGFDDIYRPNCWEDIDISYRAQKRGLKVLYEPGSLVFHKGGATVNYDRHKEIKNELLFMWKNITDDRMLLRHLLYLPKFLLRGKHSNPLTFFRGYLWAFGHLFPALMNRLRERVYIRVADKMILNRCMLYYRNLMRNNYVQERKKTVLLITPFIPYPLNCGGKIRIYNLYKRLSGKYNLILLTLIHHEDEERYTPFLREIFNDVYAVHTKTPNKEPLFPDRYRYSYSRFLIEKLNEVQEKFPLDIVHIESNELLYLAKYVKYIPVVYTEHDISILSLQNSYYHKGLYDSASEFFDYLKLVYYHSMVYGKLDHVVALSKEDKKVVSAFYPTAESSLIPTGVDLKHFKFKEKSGKKKSLIFIGHYPHYPNEEAAVYFCKQILPLVRKEIPDITLKLIGSCPTEEVMRLSGIEGVEVIGEVPDVNPYLQESSCFVTAFKRGSGIRGKVLEAMASGTPVVSTTRGAYGINALNGEEIFIADNAEKFAKCVIELLTNDGLYIKISRQARKLVEEKYDWEKIALQLDSLYQQIINEGNAEEYVDKISGTPRIPESGGTKLSSKKDSSVAVMPKGTPAKDAITAGQVAKRIDKIIDTSLARLCTAQNYQSHPVPQELHIELTHACNSKCIMCDIWDYHKRHNKGVDDELSLEEIRKLLEKSGSLKDIKTVVLSGGEPFLRKDLVEICNLISKNIPNAAIGILTNGLDTENIIFKAKAILKNTKADSFWIGSSLDGIGENYDRIRGTKGGFGSFSATVKRFNEELPEVKFSVTFVLTPFNIDQLLPCWEFSDRYGLDFFAQFGVIKPSRAQEVFAWKEEDFERVRRQAEVIIEKLITRNTNLENFSNSLFIASDKINLLTKIYYWRHLVDFQQTKKRLFPKCDAGIKFAMFDPYGNLFFCPILKEKTPGNIRDKGLDDLWHSKKAADIRDFIDRGECSCWLVCTVFPVAERALTLYGDSIAAELELGESRQIDNGNKSNLTLNNEEFRNKKIILLSKPQGVTLGSNYRCNADCMFCLGGVYKPFSLKLYKEYFEPKAGVMLKDAQHISFCGMGELLLTPDAQEFLGYINKTIPEQNKILTTNGLAFSPGILGRMMENRYSIQISLHASNQALHSQLTGVRGGFERIIKDIKYLVSHRKNKQSPYVVLVFLINTMNIEDLPNFIELAANLGVDAVQCNYLTIFKPAHLKLSCFFKQEITNAMFDKASQRAEELKVPLVLPPRFSADRNHYFKMTCSEPWKNIYIDTEGAVLPCCYSGEHFGELKDSDILSIWNNKKYQELRKGLASKDAIEMCRYCLNNNPGNVNLLNSHVSSRPDVQKKIFEDQIVK